MKKFRFVSGFVLGSMIFGTAGVFAATGGNMIEVFYNVKDIKINKTSKMPTEDKPFIFNGSTYVPLRFVAESLGQAVKWDSSTQSVLIGETEEETALYPDRDIKHMTVKTGYSSNNWSYYYDSTKKKSDNVGNEYGSYLSMFVNAWADPKDAWDYFEFPLNGQISKLKAKAGLTKDYQNSNAIMTLTIYADDKVVHTSQFKAGDFPRDLDVDLKNAAKVKIMMSTDGKGNAAELGLFDLRFIK